MYYWGKYIKSITLNKPYNESRLYIIKYNYKNNKCVTIYNPDILEFYTNCPNDLFALKILEYYIEYET